MAAVTKATVQRFCEMKNEFTISELDFHEMNNLWQLYCSAKHWEGSHLQPQWNVNLVPVECPPAYPCSPLLWIRNRQPYSQLHVENLMFRYSKMWKPRNPIYITQILLSKTQMIYHCFALLWLWLFIQLRHDFLKKEGDNSRMKGERTLNRGGRQRKSFNRNDNPITVAMLQCWTVGVNVTLPKAHQKPIEFMSNEKESMGCCCHVWVSTLLQQIVQRDTTTLIIQADWNFSTVMCVMCTRRLNAELVLWSAYCYFRVFLSFKTCKNFALLAIHSLDNDDSNEAINQPVHKIRVSLEDFHQLWKKLHMKNPWITTIKELSFFCDAFLCYTECCCCYCSLISFQQNSEMMCMYWRLHIW
jgi:hypothetical protein